MTFYVRDGGLLKLEEGNHSKAVSAGAMPLGFGEELPDGGVLLYFSTTGWTGILRCGKRLSRFQNFDNALRRAIKESKA